jgi:5-formyltetrahydrofolate cyclo-ligase
MKQILKHTVADLSGDANNKNAVRRELISRRQNMPQSERTSKQKQIASHTLNVLKKQALRSVSTYISIRGEVDLTELLSLVNDNGLKVQWALPVCVSEAGNTEDADAEPIGTLAFKIWSPEQPLQTGAFGIPVPQHSESIIPQLVLVPCVGFNASGYRLGYGGGWFDRTLPALMNLEQRPLFIGVAFACQASDGFLPEPHDIPLDGVITEDGLTLFAVTICR